MRSSPAFLLIVSFGYRDLFTIALICWCNEVQQKWFFRPVDPVKPKNAKRKKKNKSNGQPASLSIPGLNLIASQMMGIVI